MELKIIQEALRQIQGTRLASGQDTPALRVAARYLTANIALQYDQMLRLQVLEGAAGVPVGSWFGKGRLGFKSAQDALASTQIQPEWFDLNESNMYSILKRSSKALLHSYGATAEPYDLLNNALMGITIDASSMDEGAGQTLRPPYEAGKYLSAKIKQGVETPDSVAKGILGTFIKRKVQNESRNVIQPLPEDDKGAIRDIQENKPSTYGGIGEFLAALMFGRGPQSPLGKELINLMRKTWKDADRKYGDAMLVWLDKTLSGKPFTLIEFAKEVGALPQVITKYFWPDAWNAFFKALRTKEALLEDISDAASQVGIEWDPNDPIPLYWKNPMEAAKGKARPRPKVQVTASHVADRWVARHHEG